MVAELKGSDAELLGLAAPSSTEGAALAANAPLALTAWKGKASIAIMVDRNETAQMVDRMMTAMARLPKGQ